MNRMYNRGLYLHHAITILAYSWSLSSKHLSGLCVFGLLFEIPVLLMTIRDISVCFQKELLLSLSQVSPATMRGFWAVVYFLMFIFRVIPCTLWPISLIFWRHHLLQLPWVSRVVYHILGLSFVLINGGLLVMIIPRFVLEDFQRVGLMGDNDRPRNKDGEDVKSMYNAEPGLTPLMPKLGTHLRVIGQGELRMHNKPFDAWVAIEGYVCDVTTFLNSHPGGSDILLSALGSDATSRFRSAQHSDRALGMMKGYAIGQLNYSGYDQSQGPVIDAEQGDLTKPFVAGKVYVSLFGDPYILSVAFHSIQALVFAYLMTEQSPRVNCGGADCHQQEEKLEIPPILSTSHNLLKACTVLFFVAQMLWSKSSLFGTGLAMVLRPVTFVGALSLLLYVGLEYAMLSYADRSNPFLMLFASLLSSVALELLMRAWGWCYATPNRTLHSGYSTIASLGFICAFFVLISGSPPLQDSRQSICLIFAMVLVRYIHFRLLVGCLGRKVIKKAEIVDSTPSYHRLDIYQALFVLCLIASFIGALLMTWPSSYSAFSFAPHNPAMPLLTTETFTLSNSVAVVVMVFSMWLTSTLVMWSTAHFSSLALSISLSLILFSMVALPTWAKWSICGAIVISLMSLSMESELTLIDLKEKAGRHLYCTKQIENVFRHTLCFIVNFLIVVPITHLLSFLSPTGQVKIYALLILCHIYISTFPCRSDYFLPSQSATGPLLVRSWTWGLMASMESRISSALASNKSPRCFNSISGESERETNYLVSYSLFTQSHTPLLQVPQWSQ
jgi:hypothetical protein